jgi:hypothetical protein
MSVFSRFLAVLLIFVMVTQGTQAPAQVPGIALGVALNSALSELENVIQQAKAAGDFLIVDAGGQLV